MPGGGGVLLDREPCEGGVDVLTGIVCSGKAFRLGGAPTWWGLNGLNSGVCGVSSC